MATEPAPNVEPAPTGEPEPQLESATVDAAQAVLAGEHAAIYAYGFVAAFADDAGENEAAQALAYHRSRRDTLETVLVEADEQPAPAEVAYLLTIEVVDPATAAALAAQVEQRSAALYGDLVAATGSSDPLRTLAVTALSDCAVRALRWGGQPDAFPGITER